MEFRAEGSELRVSRLSYNPTNIGRVLLHTTVDDIKPALP